MRSIAIPALLLAVCGCGQAVERQATANAADAVANVDSAATATEARAEGVVPGEPEAIPAPVDPKGLQAAEQVVQRYGTLIEQGQFKEAEKLWTNTESAAEFTLELKENAETHLRAEKPGDLEGAAGSIYVTVPALFYGRLKNHAKFGSPAFIILRRVNDVPGSTEKQRRWHIERVDWQPL